MKHTGAAILAILYLLSTSGVTLYRHYCMGELAGVSMFHSVDKECNKCGMKRHLSDNKGCCEDVVINVKSTESHISSPTLFVPDSNSYIQYLPPAFPHLISVIFETPTLYARYLANAPPLINQSLLILYQNFRIWVNDKVYCLTLAIYFVIFLCP